MTFSHNADGNSWLLTALLLCTQIPLPAMISHWKMSGRSRQAAVFCKKEKRERKRKKRDIIESFWTKNSIQELKLSLISYFVSYFLNNENFHQQSCQMHTFTLFDLPTGPADTNSIYFQQFE